MMAAFLMVSGLWSQVLHSVYLIGKHDLKYYLQGISSQNGSVGKYCACILSWLHQDYNLTVEQPSLRIAWILTEQKFCN